MADRGDDAIVQQLKAELTRAWHRVHRDVPGERVYAFGIYTTECADYARPFACGELGLQRVAAEYVARGTYPATEAADNLRWSVADSPYVDTDEGGGPDAFGGRPDVYGLPDTAGEREVRFRLNAAARALKELDAEGLFGTGDDRPILWPEGATSTTSG